MKESNKQVENKVSTQESVTNYPERQKQSKAVRNQKQKESEKFKKRTHNARTPYQGKKGAVYSGKQGRKDSKSPRVNFDNTRKDRFAEQIVKDANKGNANDISWYARNPELLKSAGSIPFASILGKDPFMQEQIPGIMSCIWHQSIGTESSPLAANQAKDSMYSFMVHANSRNYNYTAADLMIMCLAGANVFSAIATIMRVYGIAKYYTEENAYLPEAMLASIGFDLTDVRNNLATLWFSINNLIAQTRQIWLPTDMPLTERWFWLNSNVYTDAPGARSQIYVFAQNEYYVYNETGVNTGSALTIAKYTNASGALVEYRLTDLLDSETGPNYITVEQYLGMIQNMINALVASQDRGIIYGDILNAWGKDKIFALSPITSDYVVAPQYNSEVLTQIENMQFFRLNRPNGILQNEEILYQSYVNVGSTAQDAAKASSVAGAGAIAPHRIMNFHVDGQPSPEAVMIASRFALGAIVPRKFTVLPTTGNTPVTNQYAMVPSCSGSEIMNSVYITKLSRNRKPVVTRLLYGGTDGNTNFEALMAFDWHPFDYNFEGANAATVWVENKTPSVLDYAYGDYDNYTVYDDSILKKLHDTALFSEFGVPFI